MRYSWTVCLFLAFFAGAAHGDAAPVQLFPGVTHENGNAASGPAVVLNNATVTTQSILLELLPHGGAIASASRSVLLGPGESQEIAELHAFLGAAEGVGMLRVTGLAEATVRLRDQDDESVLKELPAVNPEQAIAANEEVDFPFSTPADLERDVRSNLILVNLDTRDVTVTLSLGLFTALKTIPAGAFVQIDNLGGFLGTPAGIASAHAVADGRWFGTLMTVRPSAAGQRRRAVRRPPQELLSLSSFGLIDKALAAGTINAEQALTYKIFADFGDPRLPAQFRGDNSGVIGADSPGLAVQAWPTLSPATRDLIGPYLVPAFYEGSWWSLRRAGATSIRPNVFCKPWEVNQCSILTDWGYVAGKHVRVWYERENRGDDAVAADLAGEVDLRIWDELKKVMNREPILDHEMNGTNLLDVVVVDNLAAEVLATTFSVYTDCDKGATFINVNRNAANIAHLRSAFAHELFHSVQFSYFPKKCTAEYKWLEESTATWFEDYLYPKVNREHLYARKYLDFPDLSIDAKSGIAGEGIKQRNYGAYTFFFYLMRFGGGNPNTVVRNIWEATKDNDALHAFEAGLKKSGVPLETSWPGFAVYSWNREAPFNRYLTDDDLASKVPMSVELPMRLPSGDSRIEFKDLDPTTPLSLPHLSMQYFRFDFPDDTASTVAFYNGIQRALVDTPVTWIENFGNVVSARKVSDPASIKGAHVDALLKIDGKWTRENWTDEPFKTFCRDLKKERIESIVIILSNSDIKTRLQPQGQYAPFVQATNIGCYAWEVERADLTYEEDGRIEKMTVSNLRLETTGDHPDAEETPLRRQFTVRGGTYHWSISGSTPAGCTLSAPVVNENLSQGNLSQFWTFPYAQTPTAGARGVFTLLFPEWVTPRLIVKHTGATCSPELDSWLAGVFVLILDPTKSHAQVSRDGKSFTVDASTSEPNSDVTGTWKFTAKRE